MLSSHTRTRTLRQTTADHTTLLAALLAAFPRHFEMIFWPYGMYDAMYHERAPLEAEEQIKIDGPSISAVTTVDSIIVR